MSLPSSRIAPHSVLDHNLAIVGQGRTFAARARKRRAATRWLLHTRFGSSSHGRISLCSLLCPGRHGQNRPWPWLFLWHPVLPSLQGREAPCVQVGPKLHRWFTDWGMLGQHFVRKLRRVLPARHLPKDRFQHVTLLMVLTAPSQRSMVLVVRDFREELAISTLDSYEAVVLP